MNRISDVTPIPPPPRSTRNVRKSAVPAEPSVATPAKKKAAPAESRGMRIFRGILGFAMIVAIGGGVAYGARRYVKSSPRFAVTEIVTTGAKRRSVEELAVEAGIARGSNVFLTDLDQARSKLLADPWIADATLARQLPGTIFMHVTEREAGGLLASGGETYVVARDGSVIKRVEPGIPSDLPIVTGVPVVQLTSDREGAERTVRRALDLGFDYDRSPLAQRAPLEEIHVETNGEMSLVVGKSTFTLHMGGAPFRRKLEQAVRVVAELDRRGAKPDVIMLDDEARPDRVVVRMR